MLESTTSEAAKGEAAVATIQEAILSTYGSLESPTFHFVESLASTVVPATLLDALREDFDVEDDTDLNVDVSVALVLRDDTLTLALRLSMVGRFAVVFRCDPSGQVSLVEPSVQQSPVIHRLLIMLHAAQIAPLGSAILERRVPLHLPNSDAEDCSIYQALFEDVDQLPWLD